MTVKIARFGGTDWASGDILTAADLIDTFGEVSQIPLGNGTVQLTGQQTSYAQDKVDIAIASGLLGTADTVIVQMTGRNNNASDSMRFAVIVEDTTGTAVIESPASIPASTNASMGVNLTQSPILNDFVDYTILQQRSTIVEGNVSREDTNDANWINTAWTLRITARYTGSVANTNSAIHYNAYAIKG